MNLPEKSKNLLLRRDKCLEMMTNVSKILKTLNVWTCFLSRAGVWTHHHPNPTDPAELRTVHKQSVVISGDRFELCGLGDLQQPRARTPTPKCDRMCFYCECAVMCIIRQNVSCKCEMIQLWHRPAALSPQLSARVS